MSAPTRAPFEARQLESDQRSDRLLLRRAGFRRDVQQDFTQPGARDPVDDGVVHLGQRRDPAALDALDDPQFPQRPGAVQLVGHQPAHQLLELAAAARSGNADAADVEVDVEVLVLDEPRPVQSEGRAGDPPPQLRQLRQPLDDQFAESLEAVVGRVARDRRSPTHPHAYASPQFRLTKTPHRHSKAASCDDRSPRLPAAPSYRRQSHNARSGFDSAAPHAASRRASTLA